MSYKCPECGAEFQNARDCFQGRKVGMGMWEFMAGELRQQAEDSPNRQTRSMLEYLSNCCLEQMGKVHIMRLPSEEAKT